MTMAFALLVIVSAMIACFGRTVVTQTAGIALAVSFIGALAAAAGQWLLATLIWATWVGAILALAVLGAALRGGDAGQQADDQEPDGIGGSGTWLMALLAAVFWLAFTLSPDLSDWRLLQWDPGQLFSTDLVRVEAATALLLGAVIVALLALGGEESRTPEDDSKSLRRQMPKTVQAPGQENRQ